MKARWIFGRRSVVFISVACFGVAGLVLVTSGFQELPIGLIVVGTLVVLTARLRPSERYRAVSDARLTARTVPTSPALPEAGPIGKHPRLRVWMCFGAMTLALLGLQVALAKLLSSEDTAKGFAVLGSSFGFSGVALVLLPRLENRHSPPSIYAGIRREFLLFIAGLGFGSLCISGYFVFSSVNTGSSTSILAGLSGGASFSFVSAVFLTALFYGLRTTSLTASGESVRGRVHP